MRTNDLASLDEDGFLFIHGRADDALNRGGFKNVPSVIEGALRAHPAVGDASVVGIPDERLGEVPVAAVTLRAERGVAELQDWLADRLARYQVSAVVKIVNELPRTPSMKVSRPEVCALFDAAEEDQVLRSWPAPGSRGSCGILVGHVRDKQTTEQESSSRRA
ncbi:hypothetical protein [Amycolatopsis sp. cg9]|uniref:AMP-binding enzyme n=1 Tax=Amycolatopsis sp. cg9 TaxID=3238801 RepID=UPI003525250D